MVNGHNKTALRNTCHIETPSESINQAFLYAKDNIARCMRYYTLGWGMSNAPHEYTLVVGRDTGWMCLGTDYVAPWFAPQALRVFRDRQKPNGQILEYIDLETGESDDYGLNVADNTPHYLWAVWHHWQQHQSSAFLQDFLPSVVAAADHLLDEIRENDLLHSVPNGVERFGITGWRNIIADDIIAGEVTEINALSAMALRMAAQLTDETRYSHAASRIATAVNKILWHQDQYVLNRFEGQYDYQVTGDMLFPLLAGIADVDNTAKVLERLTQGDFWTARGLRTVPSGNANYHPNQDYGLTGGSWPNLTLWYATVVAPHDADRALASLEMIAEPVVAPTHPDNRTIRGEFAEYFNGDTDQNAGMPLSPWVAPTFIWSVMEGLLGLSWQNGEPTFDPNWPTDWQEVTIRNLPCADGPRNLNLRRK